MVKGSNLKTALEISANIGLIAGLVFVGLQFKQDRDLKSAELVFETYRESLNFFVTNMGESPNETVARAVFEPEALTESDLLVLDAIYSWEVVRRLMLADVEKLGLIEGDWVNAPFTSIVNHSDVGRRHHEWSRSFTDPIVAENIKKITDLSPPAALILETQRSGKYWNETDGFGAKAAEYCSKRRIETTFCHDLVSKYPSEE